jgi:hypothetical protein
MHTNNTPEATSVEDVAIGEAHAPAAPEAPKSRSIRISWGTKKEDHDWKPVDPQTFEEFSSRISHAKSATKTKDKLPAWCAGHVVGQRKAGNATGADLLVVEYDQHEWVKTGKVDDRGRAIKEKRLLPPERQTSITDALARWEGVERFLVTSYSHTPEVPRFRVVLLLSRTVRPVEFERLIHWAFSKLADAGDLIDESCADISRLWFAPCVPPSGHFYHQHVDGKPLDVDALLKEIPVSAPKKVETGFSTDSRLGERIEEIKAKIDLEDLLREDGIPMAMKGSRRVYNLRGERTPSAVYYDDGHVYDFGSSEVWDCISYYRDRHAGDDFKKSIDDLSSRAGLPSFPWKLSSRPRKVDPMPIIEALPADLPATGRMEVLLPALKAISTQDAIDQKPFIDALLVKYAKRLARKDLERALREIERPEEAEPDKAEANYKLTDGALHDGETKLVNGNVEIVEAVRHDDGASTTDFFRLRATTEKGCVIPEFEIPMTEFDAMNWLTPKTGGRLSVEPGKTTRDRLRHAILVRSTFPQTTTYGDFGWRRIEGKDVFVHAGGAIGIDTPIRVEPASEKLKRFDLADVTPVRGTTPEKTLQLAIWESLEFLDVGKSTITHPLYASIWHAPVIDVLPHRSAVIIIGQTGAMKSSLALEAQRHFGAGFLTIRDFIANFESTSAAMEIMGHSLHNCLLVVDDAWPKTGREGDKQRELCRRLIHNYANNGTRERATPDIKLRQSREIRSALWLTAETDLASASDGASTANRALKIQIEKGDIDPRKLAGLQLSKTPHLVMRAYVEWLSGNSEWRTQLPTRHREILLELRKLVVDGQLQARQPEVLASLIASTESFLKFCVAKDALMQERADEILAETRRALIEVSSEQTAISKATSPVKRYMRMIKSALNTGRARIRLPEEPLSSVPGCADIGWAETGGEHVCLQPEAVHLLLTQLDSEKAGIVSLRDVYSMMVVELGATPPTASEKGRTGVKRALGGVKQRVIEIPVEHFEGVRIPDRDARPATEDTMSDDEIARQLSLVVDNTRAPCRLRDPEVVIITMPDGHEMAREIEQLGTAYRGDHVLIERDGDDWRIKTSAA